MPPALPEYRNQWVYSWFERGEGVKTHTLSGLQIALRVVCIGNNDFAGGKQSSASACMGGPLWPPLVTNSPTVFTEGRPRGSLIQAIYLSAISSRQEKTSNNSMAPAAYS